MIIRLHLYKKGLRKKKATFWRENNFFSNCFENFKSLVCGSQHVYRTWFRCTSSWTATFCPVPCRGSSTSWVGPPALPLFFFLFFFLFFLGMDRELSLLVCALGCRPQLPDPWDDLCAQPDDRADGANRRIRGTYFSLVQSSPWLVPHLREFLRTCLCVRAVCIGASAAAGVDHPLPLA